jgi:hypothetical protein
MLAPEPDMVWNSRLCSAPLSQPLPSASSMSGLLEYAALTFEALDCGTRVAVVLPHRLPDLET